MSGDGKRDVGHRPQATAPILDSTQADIGWLTRAVSNPGTGACKSLPEVHLSRGKVVRTNSGVIFPRKSRQG